MDMYVRICLNGCVTFKILFSCASRDSEGAPAWAWRLFNTQDNVGVQTCIHRCVYVCMCENSYFDEFWLCCRPYSDIIRNPDIRSPRIHTLCRR